jgi:CheY-like chemotaxis protein
MKREFTTVMLIESDELLSDLTAFRLELMGYAVTCVRSSKDALSRLYNKPRFDLIVVNTMLADGSGLDLIKQLAGTEATRHIPLIAMSEDAAVSIADQAIHAGAKEHLTLPYEPAAFEEKVLRLAPNKHVHSPNQVRGRAFYAVSAN